MSINRVLLTGNLTRDPEVRVAGGIQVVNFGIAVNDRKRNPQGEWVDVPNFFTCVMFGNRGEAVARYISKGSKVALEGRLRYSAWESDGQKRSKVEIIVDEIEFLSRATGAPDQSSGSYNNRNSYSSPAPAPSRPPQDPPTGDIYDQDIPF